MHEWNFKILETQKFNGYCFNSENFGHKESECQSKPKRIPHKLSNSPRNGNTYYWDYNTRYSCHYYQEYRHVPKNCIRTHLRGNYSRWFNEVTCFSCLKTDHVSRNYPTRSPTLRNQNYNGKKKVKVEQVRSQMNSTWREKEVCSTTSQSKVPSSNGSSDHTPTN